VKPLLTCTNAGPEGAFRVSLGLFWDFDDIQTVADLPQRGRTAAGAPLALVAMPLYSELFQGGQPAASPP